MAADFSKLLDSDRLRPRWHSVGSPHPGPASSEHQAPLSSPLAGRSAAKPTGGVGAPSCNAPYAHPTDSPGESAPRQRGADFPAEAALAAPRLPQDSPAQALRALEEALHTQLGTRTALLGHLLGPLRAAVHRLDPAALPLPPHPLHRLPKVSLEHLLNQLEDTLNGLLLRPHLPLPRQPR